MFGYRTPAKTVSSGSPPHINTTSRRSLDGQGQSPTTSRTQAGPVKEIVNRLSQGNKVNEGSKSPTKHVVADRIAEARRCLAGAKSHLSVSRNIKTDIKTGVLEALDRLYKLVKEAEEELRKTKLGRRSKSPVIATQPSPLQENSSLADMVTKINECNKKLDENNKKMEELHLAMEGHRAGLEKAATYASVAAGVVKGGNTQPMRNTLHSVVITSKDEAQSGEQVLTRVREVMDAKEGWVKIERVRKAKDRKVIMGFASESERDRARERLCRTEANLAVEEIKNKNPLLILRGVLTVNTDEDIIKALRNQNRDVFGPLEGKEETIKVKYRKKARNPHICHVVLSTLPVEWRKAVEAGHLRIDLQRVRVEDQTPLVQCTRCLGYGHGKRFCKETVDLCSHCGGPHMRTECADRVAGLPPSCKNCVRAKQENVEHNAFSPTCQIQRKWDEIARATVAYC